MSKIEIKITLEGGEDMTAITELLKAVNGNPIVRPAVATEKVEEPTANTPTTQVQETEKIVEEPKPTITHEQVREQVSTLIKEDAGNKAKIKEKLAEVGAPNVPKIPEDELEEVSEFLKTL